uniref:Uncharacterized protein n=1 Tax=Arundo donax TaxID=35708 RepID=A0A0A9B6E1_ARUDO
MLPGFKEVHDTIFNRCVQVRD